MLVPIEQLLARAGVHASELTLMPFGGAGPMLGALLAEAAGMTRVLVPAGPGTLCALGAVAAAIRRDTMRTVLLAAGGGGTGRIFRRVLNELAAEARSWRGATWRDRARPRSLRCRRPALSRPVVRADRADDGRDRARLTCRGCSTRRMTGLRPCRARRTGAGGQPAGLGHARGAAGRDAPDAETPHAARPAQLRAAVLRDGAGSKPVCSIAMALDPGAAFRGPAIVTQPDCTILVPAGWRARVDGLRNIQMELG